MPYIPEEEMIIKADTLEELAELIGVPGEILVRTINEFNEFAAQGIDPIYHRGETMAPISPVTDTLAPLTEPPYRAISVSAGALGTCGGPRLNGNAQVVHISGEPIPGLYACGNCAGVGGPGPAYGGAGGTIGPAIVMAVLAAQHAAAREDVTESESFVPEIEKTYDYELADNEYLGVGRGVGGDIVVKVTVEGGAPTAIEVLEQYETEGVGDVVTQILPEQIVEAGSTQVEAIAGATYTSRGVIEAVNAALTQVQD